MDCSDGNDCGGLDGFDGPDHDGIDSIDLLNGAEHGHATGEHCQGPESLRNGVGVSDDGDTFVMRVLNHGNAPLFELFSNAVDRVGLLRVASILVGQKALFNVTSPSLLHTASWNAGAKKGSMPRGYADGMTGSTIMFRHFFQIPKREWGFLSKPEYDKDAGVYLDVSGMTWRYDQTGGYESQLVLRVVPVKQYDKCSGLWCTHDRKVEALRKAARNVGEMVHTLLVGVRSTARPAEVRSARPAPQVVARRPAPVVDGIRQLVFSGGSDLLSALVASPKYGAAHTIASAIPPLAQEPRQPGAPTHEGIEMVTMRLSLPRREALTA